MAEQGKPGVFELGQSALCQLKNKKHSVRVASFIWDNMRTVAQEIAPQIALRNCPEEAGGRKSDSHSPTIVSFRNKLKERMKKRNIKSQNIDI